MRNVNFLSEKRHLFHATAPLRISRNAFTICGISRIKSAVVLIPTTNDVPINGKLADLYGYQPH